MEVGITTLPLQQLAQDFYISRHLVRRPLQLSFGGRYVCSQNCGICAGLVRGMEGSFHNTTKKLDILLSILYAHIYFPPEKILMVFRNQGLGCGVVCRVAVKIHVTQYATEERAWNPICGAGILLLCRWFGCFNIVKRIFRAALLNHASGIIHLNVMIIFFSGRSGNPALHSPDTAW